MPLDHSRLLTPAALDALRGEVGDLLIVDVCAPERFARAHIPGAVHVAPAELVAGTLPATGRMPDRDSLAALFSRLGLTPATTVVACDDEGGGWAGRLLWTLEAIGHTSWKYLDGGVHAWQADGYDFTVETSDRSACEVPIELNSRVIAEIAQVRAAIDGNGTQVWDARSPAEYTGERVFANRGGHIPGAINIDWLELMDTDRALRLRSDLMPFLTERGIDLQRPVITHCQTHHRSGLTWLVAQLLGAEAAAYHGSWSEWGNRDDLPVRTGQEP